MASPTSETSDHVTPKASPRPQPQHHEDKAIVSNHPGPAPIEPSAPIEAHVGPDEEDEFVAEGWDVGSTASTSVTSSVYAHTYEKGRRYHAYKHGRYPIPNDDMEQNREDMKHALMLELTDGRLFSAPVGANPQKILDVGTGTGIWAIEVGDQHPSAEVLGLDLSPIQPTWVPPNVRFMIDDVEDEWLNGSDYDLVHFRSMALILRNLPKVIGQAYKNLKPGGWVEFQESHGMPSCDDGTMKDDDIMKRYYETCQKAMGMFGYNLDLGSKVGEYLERAGFGNVTCIKKKSPLGTWAKDKTMRLIGLYTKEAALTSIKSVMGKPFDALGISETEKAVWAARIKASVNDNSVHRYYHYYFWYAQKPKEE
ncbi:S-adenosyl-L-methionine-dependent methyltransferase [Coniochaeta sp. 2T2.1]|nr:S-adenosyl-L-methionine-dependent methyltransferase [Coniochaeta sp. 2T2.1]